MSNFRWGVLGTGAIAGAFVKDLEMAQGHLVVAVGSRSATRAQEFVRTLAGATAYGSYEELVCDKNVDAIYVATPHPFHKVHTILALNALKPVLCEKPFALSVKESQEMIDAAVAHNVALLEAM